MSKFFPILFFAFLFTLTTQAEVIIFDQKDWKVGTGGFIELDILHDSTRSFPEVVGNRPVDRPGSVAKENGRTQFSARNSRLSFSITPPVQNDWKSRAYLEMDFNGVEQTSEGSLYNSPTFRMRHGYFSAEKNNWTYIAGQTWNLFGWQPNNALTTLSVSSIAGMVHSRTAQFTAIKKLEPSESQQFQIGLSLFRPPQRDSAEMPGIDAGVRWGLKTRKSGLASATGDVKPQMMSVGLSGTMRDFTLPKSGGGVGDQTHKSQSAVAVDLMLPLLASEDGTDTANTLSLSSEFTTGKGYADVFPNWSGNLPTFATGGGAAAINPNLDAGFGGFDASNEFHFISMNTWNVQLQYHLPKPTKAFMTVGFSNLSTSGMDGLTAAAGKVAYNKLENYYVNLFHDCTSQIRVGAEYLRATTKYVDAQSTSDDRIGLAAYFRF